MYYYCASLKDAAPYPTVNIASYTG